MIKNIRKFNRTLIMILLSSLVAVSSVQARQVQDIEGKTVEIADNVERIADLWPANNQVVLLLGGADKLVATVTPIIKNPWFVEVFPKIKNVTTLSNGGDVNIESLMAQRTDVVLMSNKNQLQAIERAGLTGVLVMFQDFNGLKDTVKITADVIGGDAPQIAQQYIKELEGNIQFVAERLKGIKPEDRPSVLHISNGTNLTKIDGGMSIVGEWMKLAGGRNVFAEQANLADVTVEDVLKADPDIIIVGSFGATKGVENIKTDPVWKNLKAVKNNRIYVNPLGTFPWDRYSAEEALQVLWAAKLFHPEKFQDVDMIAKTRAFYKKYYNYELSAENAQQILNGLPPLK